MEGHLIVTTERGRHVAVSGTIFSGTHPGDSERKRYNV